MILQQETSIKAQQQQPQDEDTREACWLQQWRKGIVTFCFNWEKEKDCLSSKPLQKLKRNQQVKHVCVWTDDLFLYCSFFSLALYYAALCASLIWHSLSVFASVLRSAWDLYTFTITFNNAFMIVLKLLQLERSKNKLLFCNNSLVSLLYKIFLLLISAILLPCTYITSTNSNFLFLSGLLYICV